MVSMDTRARHCMSLELYFVVAAHMRRTVLRSSDDSVRCLSFVLCLTHVVLVFYSRLCEGTLRIILRKLN